MNRLVALLYHEVLGPRGMAGREGRPVRVASGYADVLPPPLHVHEADFAAQMDFLAREGWPVLDLAGLRNWLDCAAAPGAPECAVLICFDDLYQSFARRAAPILRRHGFKALGFACCDWIFDTPQPADDSQPVCLSWPELAGLSDVLELANHSAALHERHDGRTRLDELAAAAGDAAARSRFLADTAAGEAATGRTGIYAWPFGSCPDPARAWAREAGLRAAFGTIPGINDATTPRFALHRSLVPLGLGLDGFARLLETGRPPQSP